MDKAEAASQAGRPRKTKARIGTAVGKPQEMPAPKRRKQQGAQQQQEGVQEGAATRPCLLLEMLPEGVVKTILSFVPEESVTYFAICCKACLPYLDCVQSLTLTNAGALPSFVSRLRSKGIKHLRSLSIEHLDDQESTVTSSEVLAAVCEGAQKLLDLEELDLGQAVLERAQHLKGLGRLMKLKRLTLPGFLATLVWDPAMVPTAHGAMLEAVAREVAALPCLEALTLGPLPFSDYERDLFEPLPELPAAGPSSPLPQPWLARIKELEFSYVLNFGEECLERFMQYAARCLPNLEKLDMSFTEPPDGLTNEPMLSDCTALAKAFSDGHLKKLQSLDLSFQANTSNPALLNLAEAWVKGPADACASLKEFSMRDVSIGVNLEDFVPGDDLEEGYGGLRMLGEAMRLGRLEHLQELDLSDNFLGPEGAKALAYGIDGPGRMPHLEYLNLSMDPEEGLFSPSERRGGAMRTEAWGQLCTALHKGAPRLKRLGLGGHMIGATGVTLLMRLMDRGGFRRLEMLDLAHCQVGDVQATYLADWLANGKCSAPLHTLNLSGNRITGVRVAVASAMVNGRSTANRSPVRTLFLERNALGDCPVLPLLRLFCGPKLRTLCLAGNRGMGGKLHASAAIGHFLCEHRDLETLDLSKCRKQRYFDLKAMLKEITAPISLTSLSFTHNNLGLGGLQSLIAASDKLPGLSELVIDGQGSSCRGMLKLLVSALRKGKLPALLSLTVTCLNVSNGDAWRQNADADALEVARPWLKAFVSWPSPQDDPTAYDQADSEEEESEEEEGGEDGEDQGPPPPPQQQLDDDSAADTEESDDSSDEEE